jgi:hypothetical protein
VLKNEEEIMQGASLTTLCYIEKDNAFLMLHRTKKEHDINKDKFSLKIRYVGEKLVEAVLDGEVLSRK